MPKTILPGTKVPDLDLSLIIGTKWELAKQSPDLFTMIVFFRGLHCPICKSYLKDLEQSLETFTSKGVALATACMETEERAKKAHADWDLGDLPMAWGITRDQARDWGLYVSQSIKDDEPEMFCEPAVFWIKPDGTLYYANIANMPFARPSVDALVESIDFIAEKNYPARGTVDLDAA